MSSREERAKGEETILTIADLLQLDEIGPDRFRNRHNHKNRFRGLFGGQIVGQALAAADRTAPGRIVHSLHSYFLRAGRVSEPIEFVVERIRDGGRFSTRRVCATQGDDLLFTMDCSYRTPIEGFSHFQPPTQAFAPDPALSEDELIDRASAQDRQYFSLSKAAYPIDLRIPGTKGFIEKNEDGRRHYWLRAPGTEDITDPAEHRRIFAFLSDYMFPGAPLSRHTIAMPGPHLFVASLDHSIWFHRDMRCDDWLMFETEGTNAENGVNMTRGLAYNRAGQLVASIAQEALQYPVQPENTG